MANGMTVDQLYEAFMDMDTDDPTPFAEDVFGFFGKEELGGYTQKEWAKQYGTYLPTWDPSQVNLAGRERDLDFTTAMDTLKTTQAATERVYATEMDTLSTTLGKELSKGREMAGRTGLRSGDLESAIQDTIATTGSKAEDFGDRTRIAGQETKDTYNTAMVDAALDFEKTERQEKEEFYDRTMAAIMRLMDTGAFDDPTPIPSDCPDDLVMCGEAGCISQEECDYNNQVKEETTFNVQCDNGMWVEKDVDCALIGSGGGGVVDSICTDQQIREGCRQNTRSYNPNFFDPLNLGEKTVSFCDCEGYSNEDPPGTPTDYELDDWFCINSPQCCTNGSKDCSKCPETCPDIDPDDPCPGGCDGLSCNEGFSPMCGPSGCYCMRNPFN